MRSFEEYRQILELWEQGVNKLQISKRLNIPRGTVQVCIKKYESVEKLEVSKQSSQSVDNYELARSVMTLWEAGKTKTAIEEETGYSKYMVNLCIEQFRSLKQMEQYFEDRGKTAQIPEYKTVSIGHYGTPNRKYTDDDLRDAVANNQSYRGVLIQLGIRPAGGNYETLKKRIENLNLDTSHFRGKGWSKQQTSVHRKKRSMEEILVKNSTYTTSNHLKKRLLNEGYFEHRCMSCDLDTWLDQPIPLELDHINGDRRDNRLENLRLLCPNCHALTDTYRGKNITVATPESNGHVG